MWFILYIFKEGRSGGTGRRGGLKIRCPLKDLWVQIPPPAFNLQKGKLNVWGLESRIQNQNLIPSPKSQKQIV